MSPFVLFFFYKLRMLLDFRGVSSEMHSMLLKSWFIYSTVISFIPSFLSVEGAFSKSSAKSTKSGIVVRKKDERWFCWDIFFLASRIKIHYVPEKSNFQGAEKNILCLQTTTISLAISSILQTNYRFENTSNRRNSLISFFTCFLKAFKVGDKLGVSREQKSTTSPVKQTPASTRRPASDHSSQDH